MDKEPFQLAGCLGEALLYGCPGVEAPTETAPERGQEIGLSERCALFSITSFAFQMRVRVKRWSTTKAHLGRDRYQPWLSRKASGRDIHHQPAAFPTGLGSGLTKNAVVTSTATCYTV